MSQAAISVITPTLIYLIVEDEDEFRAIDRPVVLDNDKVIVKQIDSDTLTIIIQFFK